MRPLLFALVFACAAPLAAQDRADPQPLPGAALDPLRPLAAESRTTIADGFTLALAGDLIPTRPLTEARPIAGQDEAFAIVRAADAAFGNMETSLIDMPAFTGAAYPWDGDWANVALPGVAASLKAMGFDIVGRANNHVMDWGPEGMRETDAHLAAAGLVHAGTGEREGIARAPAYAETAAGRIALVSFATTFRPTTEAMPPHGSAPGRGGLSALHLALRVHVTDEAMRPLAAAACAFGDSCEPLPATLDLGGKRYVRDTRAWNEWVPDEADLAAIVRSVREARQHADFVLVAVHAHECAWDCSVVDAPHLPGAFLRDVAHAMVDAGADTFAATGIHNLGPIEIYRERPIFYGLGNFLWSDIQEPVPHELFQLNAELLAQTYAHPERATDYDLTAPLNAGSFANRHTFQSVIAVPRFAGGKLAEIALHPIDLGYGENLRTSGTPRVPQDAATADAILERLRQATTDYGLPPLDMTVRGGVGIVRP